MKTSINLLLISTLVLMLSACNSKTNNGSSNHTNVNDNSTGNDQNHSGSTGNNTTTDANTTTIALKTLMLTVNKTTLNKDDNTTVKVEATYSDGSTKEINDDVVWVVTPSHAVQVNNNTLTAKKDGNVTVQAMVNGVKSNTLNLNITWVVDGHVLPPEPDPAVNNATLLGVDVNDNGVRDDVERWIYREYKDKHPIHIDIAMQASRGYKLILETPERAKEIHNEVRKARHCEYYYKYDASEFNEKILIKNDFDTKYLRKELYFNTQERKDTYRQYDTLLSGNSYTLPSPEEEKDACDFNTTKYEE